ncbi:unnamed protein product [Bursaphelenchus okinawaensis]|uniref:Uncharacterized protein n=1 Tax=Bursaphelenchus okinawaensis TaxID=465554 RepID=A0A811K874_9BILA|nr:unnamed protein product [Bursaphelenchus okinawaensis]CAG9093821.1 unnamed protein product [Bursaphelenchus okinawaensis]
MFHHKLMIRRTKLMYYNNIRRLTVTKSFFLQQYRGVTNQPIFDKFTEASTIVKDLDLNGKTYLVTGATSGLGLEVAKTLVSAGAHVVMGIRNLEKGQGVSKNIVREFPEAKLDMLHLDLLDILSIKKASEEYLRKRWKLDGLILNAGAYAPSEPFNNLDGLNSTFQANYLGHFYLLSQLKQRLIESRPSRVVTLSSVTTTFMLKSLKNEMSSEDFVKEVVLTGGRGRLELGKQYAKAKLCNTMMIKKLDREMSVQYPEVRAYAVDPGSFIDTNIAVEAYGSVSKLTMKLARPFSKSVSNGAATILFAAVHPAAESLRGCHIVDNKAGEDPKSVNPTVFNTDFQDAVCKRSSELVTEALARREKLEKGQS